MSQENVEIVRRLYALLNQDDESFWGLVGPEFVFDFSRRLIDPVIRRRDEARVEYDRGRHELMADGHIGWEPRELIDAGDKVLALSGQAFGGRRAALTWRLMSGTCGRSAMVNLSSGRISEMTAPRRSKPPTCRSRRC